MVMLRNVGRAEVSYLYRCVGMCERCLLTALVAEGGGNNSGMTRA